MWPPECFSPFAKLIAPSGESLPFQTLSHLFSPGYTRASDWGPQPLRQAHRPSSMMQPDRCTGPPIHYAERQIH